MPAERSRFFLLWHSVIMWILRKSIPRGITKITSADIRYAKAFGATIKLLATSKRIGDKYYAMVCPVMINGDSPLFSVNDVFNAIVIHGNMLGDAMFYGAVQETADSQCGCS